MISRRVFLQSVAAISAVSTASAALPAELAINDQVRLRKVQVPIAKIAPDSPFANYRILFISDLHHGPFLKPAWFNSMLELIREQEYDLLILGGDYINLPEGFAKQHVYPWHNEDFKKSWNHKRITKKVYSDLSREIMAAAAKRAPDGVVAVYGNHDLWTSAEECRQSFSKQKISLMENQKLGIQRSGQVLDLHGVSDLWTGFPEIASTDLNPAAINIIVSHNPDFLSQLAAGRTKQPALPFDLGLSGHTHGGQICLPIVGGIFFNVEDFKVAKGLNYLAVNGQRCPVFTSNGLGTVEIPYRLNCPPEVVLVELKSS